MLNKVVQTILTQLCIDHVVPKMLQEFFSSAHRGCALCKGIMLITDTIEVQGLLSATLQLVGRVKREQGYKHFAHIRHHAVWVPAHGRDDSGYAESF